jgi:hypothetical protein
MPGISQGATHLEVRQLDPADHRRLLRDNNESTQFEDGSSGQARMRLEIASIARLRESDDAVNQQRAHATTAEARVNEKHVKNSAVNEVTKPNDPVALNRDDRLGGGSPPAPLSMSGRVAVKRSPGCELLRAVIPRRCQMNRALVDLECRPGVLVQIWPDTHMLQAIDAPAPSWCRNS